MDRPAALDTCPVCKKNQVESGFLYCQNCWESGVSLCLRCLANPTGKEKLQRFCASCLARRKATCDSCLAKPAEKGELLCGSCWNATQMCPLCKIEKLPTRWNICKKCFHAGARLCLKCKRVGAFPGTQTCSPCQRSLSPPTVSPAPVIDPALTDIRPTTLDEFLTRFESFLRHEPTQIVFFIGAGCSISSGIPAAGRLVQDWGFPANTPYIDAITRKFPLRSQRGEEFWRLCHDKQPAQGYHHLATLVRHMQPRMNLLVTTNFDHMIRRSLPEVLDASDPYSAQFAPWWLQHNSPVLFQLHGDYTKIVANTQDEMYRAIEDPLLRERSAVSQEVSSILRPMLQRRPQVLLIVGYSGNDANIRDFIAKTDLERDSVYWVNGNRPTAANCLMFDTLVQKHVFWVNHLLFDTFTEALLDTARRVRARPAPVPAPAGQIH